MLSNTVMDWKSTIIKFPSVKKRGKNEHEVVERQSIKEQSHNTKEEN
jgi:hypothetical protein